jgi:hypothetical protein
LLADLVAGADTGLLIPVRQQSRVHGARPPKRGPTRS